MTMYLTKVWGFSAPCGPLQFGTEGWRDRARVALKPGDLVILVGTKGEQTDSNERGRLLGMVESATEIVLSLDFDLPTRDVDFNNDGDYRWPYGLLNRRSWRFQTRPLLEEISSRQFSMDAASGIVALTDEEATKVMRLPRRDLELLSPVRTRARIEGEDAARRRAAPPPTTTRSGVMHLRRAPAYTYGMAIEGASRVSFKIGWAFDFRTRQRQFNMSALPQIGGLRYKTRLSHLWDTARDAFNMEQAILRYFDSDRHPANREVIHDVSYDALQSTWIQHLQRVRK